MKIIGINGRKRSGKDTSCQLLCEHINGDLSDHPIAVRAAFADKLKIMAAKALGYDFGGTASDAHLIEFIDWMKEHGSVLSDFMMDTEGGLGGFCSNSRSHISGRQYLQLFGGKAREVFGDTFWVDQVLPRDWYVGNKDAFDAELERRYGQGVKYLVITDVRYPNEAERVHALGGEVWEILRPDLADDGDDHATEQPLPRDLVDVSIINDGTIDELRSFVIKALEGSA